MIEIEDVPDLVSPVVIAAFEGWNDAADAASGLVDHLIEVWDAEVVGAIDPEEFYDFQVNRPIVGTDDNGHRRLTWPTTRIAVALPAELRPRRHPGARHRAQHALAPVLRRAARRVRRPRRRARRHPRRAARRHARTPGRSRSAAPRPSPSWSTGSSSSSRRYEGPTGIVGVFQDACAQLDIPAVSYWAAVPHYVAQPPCPKATLALLGQLEELLEAPIPLGDLAEDARAWERGVDELAEEDEDVADYVRALEETRDTADLPEATGEAIAREFERYLKRRDTD